MVIDKHIADLLARSHCVDVSKYDESFLNKALQKRISATHCGSAEEYCALLEQHKEEEKKLLDSLSISYSQFFRNPITFAVLERVILPSIALKKTAAKRKEIRIWSTACAAGQEAYSLAILLEELRSGDANIFSYRIFATDQCESQILEAQKGQYLPASLNDMSMKRAGEWFTRQGDLYVIKPALKESIDFAVFDLLNEQFSCPSASIFGDFDLIICANLLFYYRPESRKRMLNKIGSSLAPDGYLITGEAEREIVLNCNYQEVFPQSAIFCVHDVKGKTT